MTSDSFTIDAVPARRLLLVLGVVFLVGLAGCAGVLDDDGGDDASAESESDADDLEEAESEAEDDEAGGDSDAEDESGGEVSAAGTVLEDVPVQSDASPSGPSGDLVQYVPEGNDMLVHADGDLLVDDTSRDLVLEMLDEDIEFDEPTDEQDEAAEALAELDPLGFEAALMYGQTESATTATAASGADSDEIGIVFSADWSEDQLVDVLNANESMTFEEVDHEGDGTLYGPVEQPPDEDPAYFGVLADGTYVFGDEQPVRESLDVADGAAESVSGPARDLYDEAPDGYVTIAMAAPEEGTAATTQDDPMQDMNAMGFTYTADDGVSVGLQISFSDSASAQEVEQLMGVYLDMAAASEDDPLLDELERVEVDRSGATVEFSYQNDVQSLLELYEELDEGEQSIAGEEFA